MFHKLQKKVSYKCSRGLRIAIRKKLGHEPRSQSDGLSINRSQRHANKNDDCREGEPTIMVTPER